MKAKPSNDTRGVSLDALLDCQKVVILGHLDTACQNGIIPPGARRWQIRPSTGTSTCKDTQVRSLAELLL